MRFSCSGRPRLDAFSGQQLWQALSQRLGQSVEMVLPKRADAGEFRHEPVWREFGQQD